MHGDMYLVELLFEKLYYDIKIQIIIVLSKIKPNYKILGRFGCRI